MTSAQNPLATNSGELDRRRAANRRLGWSLALVALALFLITLLLRS